MKIAICYLWAHLILGVALTGFAQGTAFPYQGRLLDNGQEANGNYEFSFALFDSEQGGAQQGATQSLTDVPVTAGQFAVALDFGPVFTGSRRWLEVGVRKQGAAEPLVLLRPRRALLPTPYAIHAGTAGGLADAVVTETKLAPNAVVKSLNGLRDAVTLAAGANVTITPTGNTLTIAATGGGGGGGGGNGPWSLNGTSAFYDQGHVGIGVSTPRHRLRISGGPLWTDNGWLGAIELDHASAIGWNATSLGNLFGIGHTDHGLFFFTTSSGPGGQGSLATYHMVIADSGNIGIGTTAPSSKLTLYQPGSGNGLEHSNGTVSLGTYINSDGGWFGTHGNHKLHFFVNNGRSSLIFKPTGKAGVAPPVIFDPPIFIIDPPVADPPLVEPPIGLGRSSSMTIDTSGFVGIGTSSPATHLHVMGSGLTEARIQSFGERAILSLHGFNRTWTMESGVFGQPGLFAIYDRGSGRARLTIDTAGLVAVDALQINGGADLSEDFDVQNATDPETEAALDVEPGTVVSIDPDHPGKLATSREAYDRRVAGVISGAGGIKPGMRMGQADSPASGEHPVALTGRVYVKADAAYGPILPGDLLTTSDTPGHAMRVGDHTRAQGAILGKAMSQLGEGQGLVLILVTLQ